MVSTTSKSDSTHEEKETLNSKNPKNFYQIGGIQVEFPYQPYGTQLAFMSRVISTLDRAQRDGHSHALLESPTGTGKSLSLLCSVLAWQQNYSSRFPQANMQPSDAPLPSDVEAVKQSGPTIFYASRTHAQIAQVIREYRKTGYRVPMTVLASRKRYCTNRHVRGKENVDEKCRLLIRNPKEIKCTEYKGIDSILSHPSLNQKGHIGVHDIEDLVKIGEDVCGCPYFASWKMLEDAQLVFCPYSYIIDPVIRENIELTGAIIIFDEAHNMEDIAREAGSIELEEETLVKLQNELEELSVEDPEIYQPVYEVIEGLISWIGSKKDSLAKRDEEHYFSGWTGDKALRELKESDITQDSLKSLNDAIVTEANKKPDMPHLSGISISTLEEMHATLKFFFSTNGSYELGLQRSKKRGDPSDTWTYIFSLWCMNPSVVFRDLTRLSLSIILTSGTLSPMNSFSSELGMKFGTCLEAPHVIDANLQVWAAAISKGPGNYTLNASYKTADEYSFQDALGKSLEEICTIVPGGSLVFFPSYKLMEKLCTRWHETGQWSRLCLINELFVEPRGGAKDDFKSVLDGYYDSISGKNRLIGRNRRGNKAGPQDDTKKGAAFLAVCRGKVSEGLDFSDDNARAVIIVGIPFPNLRDILVELKRKYNDTYKLSKHLLGGNQWYCQQAYRALNQAAGRCIRHRFDYGAIIFLDERYRQERNRESISKWLRQSIKLYDNFEASMEGLRSFFHSVKERVESKMSGSHDYTVEQNLSSENQIQKKSSHAHTFVQVKQEDKLVIDLEYEVKPEPRCCEVSSVTNCDENSETSFVKINGISAASPCSCSKNESCSTATALRSPDQFLKPHISSANLRKSPLGAESSVTVTLAAESPLNRSVNSHALKRRKFTSSPVIIDLEEENTDHTSFTRRIEFGFESSEPRSQNYNISCLVCRSPLGHPDSYLNCSLTSLSKTYLLSLLKETGSAEMPTSVSVIITDCSLVNQRLCTSFEGSKGIWCEQDGCVFNTIFCPFCSVPNTCLGVQVMATDSSNVQFMSKILFFADHLQVTDDVASKETTSNRKESNTAVDKSDVFKSTERFAYSPKQQQDSVGGWSSTKSKLRLPKRNLPTSKQA